MSLEKDFKARREKYLLPLEARLKGVLDSYLRDLPRIDRVSTRVKSVDRFIEKANKLENGQTKYADPLNQIQDQIAARVVTYYLSDVDTVGAQIRKYLRPIETRQIVPDSENEFGYVGTHYILLIPTECFDDNINEQSAVPFFELQVKTLFQHAWSEAEHDLGYKEKSGVLLPIHKRKIAFTAAQAWGADRIFHEMLGELSERSST